MVNSRKQTMPEKIIEYIRKNKQATGQELADFFDVTSRAIRKHLLKLINEEKVYKVGKPPKVFYLIKKEEKEEKKYSIDKKVQKIINENYLFITPAGQRKEGIEGFINWCEKTNQPIEKTVLEYIATFKKYNKFKKEGLINGTSKIKSTFKKSSLNKLFYLDFYSIERFGKTKLGQLLLYAKQTQNKKLIKEIAISAKPKVNKIIEKYKIDGIGFVPPTVKREVQLMEELEKNLNLKLREVSIVKVKTDLAVPQKTLNRIEDRIENARETFIVDEGRKFENILLIDDAVGSGSTLNEIAQKIKERKICSGKIIALAITGSFKGFDVISEV